MVQSRGILGELLVAVSHVMFLAGKALKKGKSLAPKLALKLAEQATEY